MENKIHVWNHQPAIEYYFIAHWVFHMIHPCLKPQCTDSNAMFLLMLPWLVIWHPPIEILKMAIRNAPNRYPGCSEQLRIQNYHSYIPMTCMSSQTLFKQIHHWWLFPATSIYCVFHSCPSLFHSFPSFFHICPSFFLWFYEDFPSPHFYWEEGPQWGKSRSVGAVLYYNNDMAYDYLIWYDYHHRDNIMGYHQMVGGWPSPLKNMKDKTLWSHPLNPGWWFCCHMPRATLKFDEVFGQLRLW